MGRSWEFQDVDGLWKPVASDDQIYSTNVTGDTYTGQEGWSWHGKDLAGQKYRAVNQDEGVEIPFGTYENSWSKSWSGLPDWAKAEAQKGIASANSLLGNVQNAINDYGLRPFEWFKADSTPTANGQQLEWSPYGYWVNPQGGFLTRALQTMYDVPEQLKQGVSWQRGQLLDNLYSMLSQASSATNNALAARGLGMWAPQATPSLWRGAMDSTAQALAALENETAKTLANYGTQQASIAGQIANAMAGSQTGQQQLYGNIATNAANVLAALLQASRESTSEQQYANPLQPYTLLLGGQ